MAGFDHVALRRADSDEADSIRRFRQLCDLRDLVGEAARRAEANLRLENAMRYASARPSSRG